MSAGANNGQAAPPLDDAPLVRNIANGDRGSLAHLYDRYAAILLALGERMLGQTRDAEDVLHDVFLEVWQHAGDYNAEKASVRTWLIMRMRSRSLDRLRSVGFARVVSLEDNFRDEPMANDDGTAAADKAVVRKSLSTLSQEQRTVLELSYFEGLSASEISVRVNVPLGTIKSRMAAGLAKLRAGLVPGAR